MPQQDHQPGTFSPIQDARAAGNIVLLAAQSVAAPVEAFLRVRFGRRYFHVPAFLGLFIVPLWMLFWPLEDPRGILLFWCAYIVMQIRARIEMLWRSRMGLVGHSRYNGYPRLARLFRRMPEERIKAVVEPTLVMATGAIALVINAPLGSYLIAAGAALAIVAAAIRGVERMQVMDIRDAWLENEALAERFRKMRNDHL